MMKRHDDLATHMLHAFVARHATLRDAANELGVSRQYLWRLLTQRDRMSPRLLRHLGLTKTVVAI